MSAHNPSLRELEAESIEIIRETGAAFRKPVVLYSIGKDFSISLHLAGKAFAPGAMPIPVMHIDTSSKFNEMISLKDKMVKKVGFALIVQTNHEGIANGVAPFSMGAFEYTR